MSESSSYPPAALVSLEGGFVGGGVGGSGVGIMSSTSSLGSRKCEAFIMTGEMMIRTSPQRVANKARSKSASGMGGVLSVSPAHRSNSADPNSSTVDATDSPRRRRKRSGTADEATTVTTKEAAFFASRECVNPTESDSMMTSPRNAFNSDDDHSPSSPPPLPPHGLFAPLDNDDRSNSSHSSSPSNSETVFNHSPSHQSTYVNGNVQSERNGDPLTTVMMADEANANVATSSSSPPASPPDPSQERHIPKFIPLDEENWVASNKFRRLPPGAISPSAEEAMEHHQIGKTLPTGELSLCFAEAYGDLRGGKGEITGQVEVAFRSPIKDVDRASAARLASRLFHLTGFKRSDVARHLGKSNEFSQLVTSEYLALFDFSHQTLDAALRKFLDKFCLTGESQERERVLQQFSKRYVENNPSTFKSEDACHALTCAIMLLNTDHHGQSICRKMTLNEFIENLSGMNDGGNFPRDILKPIFNSIKNEKLVWAQDQPSDDPKMGDVEGVSESFMSGIHNPNASSSSTSPSAVGAAVVGSNPFLEVPDPSKALEYKKGPVMRKCCVSAEGRRTPYGKRGWRMFYAALRDQVLYLHKNVNTYGKFVQTGGVGGDAQSGQNAIRVHHCLAVRAQDYTKKQNVLRLFTADWAEYLFQCSDAKEMQGWIDTLNFVAASLSAPPLPSACGSRKKFQRPLMPASITKLNLLQQLQSHVSKVKEIEEELESLRKNPPGKKAKSAVINDYNERNAFYQFELRRFKTYQYLLEARMASAGTPSLVEESIAEETSDVASPEVTHKTLLPEPTQEASTMNPSTDCLTGGSTDEPNNAFSSSPSAPRDEQSPPPPSVDYASGPKFDEDCIPEAATTATPPSHRQNNSPRQGAAAAPAAAAATTTTPSPKNMKKKPNQNPRVKHLQTSPNKATDRYSYRAAIYGETEGGL